MAKTLRTRPLRPRPLWTVHGDGKSIRPGEVVAPSERLSWPRTIGIGAQHVVSMFGATFVFPIIMGLNPQLAIGFSGVCTLLFLAVVKGRVPSYLGTSVAFVGAVAAIRAQGGTSAEVTGAMLVAGVALLAVGLLVHVVGGRVVTAVLPPVVTGAVVMLLGFNLAPVVAETYWPQDQWVALVVMVVLILMTVGLKGFAGRIAIFLSLVFGYVLSWVLDVTTGPITSFSATAGEVTDHLRVDWSAVGAAPWIGLPPMTDEAAGVVGIHAPDFSLAFVLLVVPGVIALIAENAGHVKAIGEITRTETDGLMGRALAADGAGTVLATSFGGSATTTYAENIGVMAATKVYSTASYVVAAVTAILLGCSPKLGAVISATPGGVLGGITVVLYGMIGLLGAKIWKENRVDFGNPLNLVPVAAGVVIAVGDTTLHITDDLQLGGIALGTLVVVLGYHLGRVIAPGLREQAERDEIHEMTLLGPNPDVEVPEGGGGSR